MAAFDPKNLQRRVAGFHDQRLDGVSDILSRCRGASVLDVGCNRGLVSLEFARNGARVVHGVDSFEEGICVCRNNFVDLRYVQSWQFEVVDLTQGPSALTVLQKNGHAMDYDITVMLATFHKLRRAMSADLLGELMHHLARHTEKYFVWRGTDPKAETADEFDVVDEILKGAGMKCVQQSSISDLGVAGIWERLR